MPFEEIEHTADRAIRVQGEDLPNLFIAAAQGMYSLMVNPSSVEPNHEVEMDLRAIDLETLLVDWLNELLFLCEERGLVFTEFQVHDLEEPESERPHPIARFHASMRGDRVEPERRRSIKAVTFNDVAIERHEQGYQVQIVFDV